MDEETMSVETDDDEIAVGPETDDEGTPEKGVSSDLIRGHINTIILRSLYDGDKYGYEIIAEIERKSSGQYSLKQPSLYSALKRLEKDGYITSYWGGSVGGGRRKYFSLTDDGKAISEQNRAEWEYSRTIIDSLISDRDFDFNNPAPSAVDMSVLRKSTSRVPSSKADESEGGEFSFEPEFGNEALREQLEKNARQKEAELEASYEEKLKALEAEYADKLAALDRDRAGFESAKTHLEEEMSVREKELADSYEANLKQLDLIRAQQEAAIQAEKEAFERDKEEFESEKAEFAGQKGEAQAEADESIRNELELQKQKNAEETEEHKQAIAALKMSNEQALAEQREADEASLRAEKELRERALKELGEKHEKELSDLAEKHLKEMENLHDSLKNEQETAVRLAREEEGRLREAQYQAEKARYSELLDEERNRYDAALAEESARHEAQIREDRARYQQALDEQLALLRKQMECEMEERQKQLIHNNFISLVNTPSSQQNAPQTQPAPVQDPARNEDNYRDVVSRLYENTVRPATKPADVAATPVSGIDFRDIEKRAKRDGLHVDTVGSDTPSPAQHTADDVNTVHKGKALFLSAIAVFFWCILVGGIAIGLKGTLDLPVFYPYLMWCLGLVFLLTAGLMYANRFGANRLRKPTLSLINSIVIYALLVIIALIVALSVRIDFGNISQLMTYVILPAVYFVGVLIFGLCYFLQVKPKKKD